MYRESKVMNIAAQVAPVTTPASRTPRLRVQLVETFEELSGMDLSNGEGASTFLEMGFDSLFLTQVTQALQTKFGLKIAFRQLLGDESTFDALADYLDRNLPPEVSSEPIAPVLSTTADKEVAGEPSLSVLPTASAVADNGTPPQGSVERLMHEQLQAIVVGLPWERLDERAKIRIL